MPEASDGVASRSSRSLARAMGQLPPWASSRFRRICAISIALLLGSGSSSFGPVGNALPSCGYGLRLCRMLLGGNSRIVAGRTPESAQIPAFLEFGAISSRWVRRSSRSRFRSRHPFFRGEAMRAMPHVADDISSDADDTACCGRYSQQCRRRSGDAASRTILFGFLALDAFEEGASRRTAPRVATRLVCAAGIG